MKKILFSITALIFSLSAFSQNWIRLEEAQKHIGDTLNMIGLVTKVESLKGPHGYTIKIRLNGENPDHAMTLISSSSVLQQYADYEIAFLNQYVQVKGIIEISKGKPLIKVNSARQLAIIRVARGEYGYEPE